MVNQHELDVATYFPEHIRGYYGVPILPGADIEASGLVHTSNLPEGYAYASQVGPAEAAELLTRHYPTRTTPAAWMTGNAKEMHAGKSVVVIGVREVEANTLVGLGRLSYREINGVLSDFVVHAEHRSRGIGRAIINERIAIADQIGVVITRLPFLEDSNTLKSYYQEKGFKPTSGRSLSRVCRQNLPVKLQQIIRVNVVSPTTGR